MPKPLATTKSPRSAVVTGAARGIGRAIAAELVGTGFQVIVTDVDLSQAEITAKEIGAVAGLSLDVTDEVANGQVARQATAYAPLGAWVCNAGVGFDGNTTDLTSAQIRTLVDVNFTAVIWGVRAAAEVFREQAAIGIKGGDIGITASLSAHGPVPGLSVYAATKAAVLSLATSISVELKRDKILVHAVCPDGTNTQMVSDMKQDGQARELIAAGQFLQPAEVARAMVDMFGTRRVYTTLPRSRGVLMRASSIAPGPMMRALPLIRRMGRRKLGKGHAS